MKTSTGARGGWNPSSKGAGIRRAGAEIRDAPVLIFIFASARLSSKMKTSTGARGGWNLRAEGSPGASSQEAPGDLLSRETPLLVGVSPLGSSSAQNAPHY
jgi:hypothetical protein